MPMRPGERAPSGGGELLRAVLDDAAIYADYVFYNIMFPITPLTNPGNPFVNLRAPFQCKSDCWFLMTAMYGAGFRGNPSSETESWNLISGANSKSLMDNQTLRLLALLFNQNFSSRATFADYPLFAPADMITVELRTKLNLFNPFQDTNMQDFAGLTLEGVEYRFRN